MSAGVKYSKLYSLATRGEMCFMYIGWLTASLAGLGMPSFVFLIGSIVDSFNPATTSPTKMLSTIKMMSGIFGLIGLFVWVTTYISYSSLLIFGERVAKRTRVKYLEAILKQESAWFDLTNP